MSFDFKCPYCSSVSKAEVAWIGMEAECLSCQKTVIIEANTHQSREAKKHIGLPGEKVVRTGTYECGVCGPNGTLGGRITVMNANSAGEVKSSTVCTGYFRKGEIFNKCQGCLELARKAGGSIGSIGAWNFVSEENRAEATVLGLGRKSAETMDFCSKEEDDEGSACSPILYTMIENYDFSPFNSLNSAKVSYQLICDAVSKIEKESSITVELCKNPGIDGLQAGKYWVLLGWCEFNDKLNIADKCGFHFSNLGETWNARGSGGIWRSQMLLLKHQTFCPGKKTCNFSPYKDLNSAEDSYQLICNALFEIERKEHVKVELCKNPGIEGLQAGRYWVVFSCSEFNDKLNIAEKCGFRVSDFGESWSLEWADDAWRSQMPLLKYHTFSPGTDGALKTKCTKCRRCGREVPEYLSVCPYCGYLGWWRFVGGFIGLQIFAVVLFFVIANDDPKRKLDPYFFAYCSISFGAFCLLIALIRSFAKRKKWM